MVKQLQYKRLVAPTVLLALAFIGLGYRLVDLQVLRHDELAKEARSNTQYTFRLEPRRGDILDCKGNLLATSTFVKTVCADPSLMGDQAPEVARALAPLLQLNPVELEKRLTPRQERNKKGELIQVQYVTLKRKVTSDVWEKIQELMDKFEFGVDEKKLNKKQLAFYHNLRTKAIFTDPVDDQLRNYPNGALASHVIGFVGVADQTNSGAPVQVTVGVDGIERQFDAKMRGVRGMRVTERDHDAREMVSMREEDVPAQDGLDVVLTIDSVIQQILETELAQGAREFSAANICGLAIRPRTGEILGMASLPNYDPNHPGGPGVTPEMLRNRVIKDAPEPGSTFKIVVISGALNDHLVKLTDRFDCEHGEFKYCGVMLHDHNGGSGILEVKDIIAKSSNIGAAKIGIMMKEQRLNDYVRAFGFGATTGVPLPYEFKGIVNDRTNWSKISITRIPMGQEIGVTPLQMAMAMSAIANKGILMQPMLVDRLVAPDKTVAVKYYPQPVRRIIGEEADHDIIEALKTVVLPGGTAIGAAMTNYTVAGKTGTAQEVGAHGYADRIYYASFIGFFPADDPEICIYVGMQLDDPKGAHEGGRTSALVFKKIATQAANYLNIRPDRGEATGAPEAEPTQSTASEPPLRTLAAHMP